MFYLCRILVGGQGTTWDISYPEDKTYAHIDGGPDDPGYFMAKAGNLRGDVNGDGSLNMADVSELINLLLTSGTATDGADATRTAM